MRNKLFLNNKIRNSVNLFYWIAGLSLANTIVFMLGIRFAFVFRLGINQFASVFLLKLTDAFDIGLGFVRIVGFIVEIIVAGAFIVFGILGNKRRRASIVAGMILYAIDGAILLLFQGFPGVGFHVLVLFGIGGGLKSIADLESLEKSGTGEPIGNLEQPIPPPNPTTGKVELPFFEIFSKSYWIPFRRRLIAFVAILVAIIFGGIWKAYPEAFSCAVSGGRMVKGGFAQRQYCLYSYPDVGKACQGSKDCMGACILESYGDIQSAPIAGVCAPDNNPIGCQAYFEYPNVTWECAD